MIRELIRPILAQQQTPGSLEEARKRVEEADHLATVVATKEGLSPLWTSQVVERLTWGVLIFATVVIVLMTVLLYRKDLHGHQTLKCFGLVLIITLSSVLLIVGYSSEQLTPIIGLFGAIAGYLLGKESGGGATTGGDGPAKPIPHVLPATVVVPVEERPVHGLSQPR